MRVTPSMYYKSLYGEQNTQLNNKLFDVNKQIASGIKIQYAKDDVSIFAETMRLDNEIVVLSQIKKSTESGLKVSDQADEILNEFTDKMKRMGTLLISAGNDTHDTTSRDAIAAELRGIESNLKSLANTSINGQFIFSGSAIDVMPISKDGIYNGNDVAMKAFLGSKTQQQYNISGAELFLGEDLLTRKEVITNVVNTNLISAYPALQSATEQGGASLSGTSSIRDLMGDNDNVIDTVNMKHYFYVSGFKSDGTAVSEKISMRDNEKIDDLLSHIGDVFGNTPSAKVVNVSLNGSGQIVVSDKIKGSSKLDFHIVGAVDLSGGAAANVLDVSDLDDGETDFSKIMLGTSTATNTNLHVKEFIKSSYSAASTSDITNISGLYYDKTNFSVKGNTVSSNVAQIVKGTNAFATPSTKISQVADLSNGTATTADDTLDGKKLKLSGTDVNGTAFDVQINFENTAGGGSTFSLNGNTYKIFDVGVPRGAVNADDMTYQQLMDVVNMVTTNNLPASTNVDTDYDNAVLSSNLNGVTSLSYDGKLKFGDLNFISTKATIALYDDTSTTFTDASIMTFNTNNAITVKDPKTDFFKTIDKIISAVEEQKIYPDSSQGDMRNVGIENAIAMMNDLQNHVFTVQSKVGAQSNTLSSSLDRITVLESSTKILRSSVIDTDLAEASLTLTQLTNNYNAMLSTVGKISKLSLVNFL